MRFRMGLVFEGLRVYVHHRKHSQTQVPCCDWAVVYYGRRGTKPHRHSFKYRPRKSPKLPKLPLAAKVTDPWYQGLDLPFPFLFTESKTLHPKLYVLKGACATAPRINHRYLVRRRCLRVERLESLEAIWAKEQDGLHERSCALNHESLRIMLEGFDTDDFAIYPSIHLAICLSTSNRQVDRIGISYAYDGNREFESSFTPAFGSTAHALPNPNSISTSRRLGG